MVKWELFSLCLGFSVQAIAYVVVIGHGSARTGGVAAYLVAALCAIGVVGLTLALSRNLRWLRFRAFLVEVARYDGAGDRGEPDLSELARYGRILGKGPSGLNANTGQVEDLQKYTKRIWKV